MKGKLTEYEADLRVARELKAMERAGILPVPDEPDSSLEAQLSRAYVPPAQSGLDAHLNSFSGYKMLPAELQQIVRDLYLKEIGENLSESFDMPEFTGLNMKLGYLSEFVDFFGKTSDFRPDYYAVSLQRYFESETGQDLYDIAVEVAERAFEYFIRELDNVPKQTRTAVRAAMTRKVNEHHKWLNETFLWQGDMERLRSSEYAFEQIEFFMEDVLKRHKLDPYQMLADRFGFQYSRFMGFIEIGQNSLRAGVFSEYGERINERLMQLTNFVDQERRLQDLIDSHYR